MATPTSILITGGTGSFGTAFVGFALAQPGVRRIRVISRSESRQHAMRQAITDPRLEFVIGDVRDRRRMARACAGDFDTLVHAAALKHVPACEDNPDEAVLTNVIGTQSVRDASIAADLRTALLISTDKAVEASTTYGKTKALAESLWLQGNTYTRGRTRLGAVRYGNVLASSGSVLPLWQGQIAKGEPLTLTEGRMTRFWWTLEQACAFVWRVLSEIGPGDLWVPKLPAATVADLASAFAPGHPVRLIPARGWEKLDETLVSAHEASTTMELADAYVVRPACPSWPVPPLLEAVPVAAGFAYSSAETMPVRLVREVACAS